MFDFLSRGSISLGCWTAVEIQGQVDVIRKCSKFCPPTAINIAVETIHSLHHVWVGSKQGGDWAKGSLARLKYDLRRCAASRGGSTRQAQIPVPNLREVSQ